MTSSSRSVSARLARSRSVASPTGGPIVRDPAGRSPSPRPCPRRGERTRVGAEAERFELVPDQSQVPDRHVGVVPAQCQQARRGIEGDLLDPPRGGGHHEERCKDRESWITITPWPSAVASSEPSGLAAMERTCWPAWSNGAETASSSSGSRKDRNVWA